jgi:hypothetical protein
MMMMTFSQPIISSAQWADEDQTLIITMIDGKKLLVPDDLENRHRAAIAAWEAQGNEIDAYEAE